MATNPVWHLSSTQEKCAGRAPGNWHACSSLAPCPAPRHRRRPVHPQGLEKYVLSKLWRLTFGQVAAERERDERCVRLCRALGFVTLDTLMGTRGVTPDADLLAVASKEVLTMDKYKVRVGHGMAGQGGEGLRGGNHRDVLFCVWGGV